MKIAIIGATGLVGTKMIQVLEEQNFPVSTFIPVASEQSVGKTVLFKNIPHTVVSIDTAIAMQPDIALFSAGGGLSLSIAPLFTAKGTVVIDNSSAWRMHPDVKLIVPEINGNILTKKDTLIANPNCSTIQMVMALHTLHAKYEIDRIVVSTYQGVTGTGVKAVTQLNEEKEGKIATNPAYKYPIHNNCIPQIDVFLENGYTKEEMKMVLETRKILANNDLKITATAVRIPVLGGHSESVNVSFKKAITLEGVRNILSTTSGVVLQDDITECIYPVPLLAADKNDVFVGRLRIDESQDNTLNMWVVSDNLRKGAATNAVQIAKKMYDLLNE